MKIIVTNASTSLKSLIETAWYDLKVVEKNRIKEDWSSNNFGVYIENIWANSIHIENFFSATVLGWKEIKTTADFSLDVAELSEVYLMSSTGTVNTKILLT